MKKLLIVLLALAIVGVFAVAEDAPASISIGGFGRAWYSPVASDGSDSIVKVGPNWGGVGGNCAVGFNGNSENVGFSWNPRVSGGDKMVPAADQAKIWVKINPMFKVELGMIQGDTLRGKLGDYGDVISMGGEDNIFQRFNPQKGILVDITPMDGVYIGFAMDYPAASVEPETAGKFLAEDAYKTMQIGAGYVIPNVGHFRAQYIGETAPGSYGASAAVTAITTAMEAYLLAPTAANLAALQAAMLGLMGKQVDMVASAAVQVAFAYTAMEGLVVDAGFKFPFESDNQMKAAVGASYKKDALSTYDRIDVTFGGKDADRLTLGAAGQVAYALQAPLSVGVEVAYNGMSNVDADYDARTLDVFPFVQLGYSNGLLKVGFDYTAGLDNQDPSYSIPIMAQYSF